MRLHIADNVKKIEEILREPNQPSKVGKLLMGFKKTKVMENRT